MKKLMFFKSSSSNGRENQGISTPVRDRKHYVESRWKAVISRNVEKKFQSPESLSPLSDRKVSERKMTTKKSVILRRSRSLSTSSAADANGRLGKEDQTELRNRTKFPSSSKGASGPLCDCSYCHFHLIDSNPKPERHNVHTNQIPGDEVLFDRGCSVPSHSSSPQSSSGSTSIPGRVLDLYIDGEQHQEMKSGIANHHSSKITGLLKGRSHSSSSLFFPSHDASRLPLGSKCRQESPRKLAKDVVERLLRLEQFCDSKPRYKQFDGHNSMVLKLERERDELQSCFHRELDRKEDKWASKLQEYQSEERRLRDRVNELAEQNVCLQKEITSSYTKEQECNDSLSHREEELKDITEKLDQAMLENEDLQKKLSEIQDELKVAQDIGFCMERNYREKEKENTGLIKSIAKLQETCSQQERTIDGLRQSLNSEIEEQQTSNNLQMEQLRLTEVQQALQRQLETCRIEVESLRHENIYLFERLKGFGKAGSPSTLKLDQELESYVRFLNDIGLSLLNESTQMCVKLLDIIKTKASHDGFLDVHSLVEYDLKIQGFKQDAQQLERSVRKAVFVLKEKDSPASYDQDSSDADIGRFQNTNSRKVFEDDPKSELKAECLVTSILKEKLLSKEVEIEKLQTELARALRNHDVLKSEIQDAFDTISCANHKMKNLELQMIKKNGMINQVEGEVRSQGEELSTTKGVLSKVSQERDMMWEEVKQYSEKNMLLNREVHSLKKKIETLEEDTLLKDGQISILKDSLNNAQAFGLDHRDSFRL